MTTPPKTIKRLSFGKPKPAVKPVIPVRPPDKGQNPAQPQAVPATAQAAPLVQPLQHPAQPEPQPPEQPDSQQFLQPQPAEEQMQEAAYEQPPEEQPQDILPQETMIAEQTQHGNLHYEATQVYEEPPDSHATPDLQQNQAGWPEGPKQSDTVLDDIKEQIQNYLELCDTLTNPDLRMEGLAEILFLLVRSLNLDFLSLCLIETGKMHFRPPLARGLRNPPRPEVVRYLEVAISDDKISWSGLMKAAAQKESPYAAWLVSEKIDSVGFVPIHDCRRIFGFMIVGAYSKKDKSPIASQMLEICGSRMGMALSLREKDSSSSAPLARLAPIAGSLKASHSKVTEYFELISTSVEEKDGILGKIIARCKESIGDLSRHIENLYSEIQKKE